MVANDCLICTRPSHCILILKANIIIDRCLLHLLPQITGLIVPASLILSFNVVVFVLAIWRISRTRMGKNSQQSRHRERIRRVLNASIILTLLGLSWIFGFLVNVNSTKASEAFEVIFILLNSFQGLAIFVIYCVKPVAARKQLTDILRCRKVLLPGQSSGATHSSKMPSSPVADQNKNKANKVQQGEKLQELSPRREENVNHYVSS